MQKATLLILALVLVSVEAQAGSIQVLSQYAHVAVRGAFAGGGPTYSFDDESTDGSPLARILDEWNSEPGSAGTIYASGSAATGDGWLAVSSFSQSETNGAAAAWADSVITFRPLYEHYRLTVYSDGGSWGVHGITELDVAVWGVSPFETILTLNPQNTYYMGAATDAQRAEVTLSLVPVFVPEPPALLFLAIGLMGAIARPWRAASRVRRDLN